MRFVSFLLFTVLSLVAAATPPPPRLVPGQFVYTDPPGFAPDGLSGFQQQQLNMALSRLHYPFYVVLYQETPWLDAEDRGYARVNGFSGDEDTQRIEVTTSRLMERWASSEPGFNPGQTTVFVMGFSPRKFAWHPGLTWTTQVGVNKAEQKQYTERFLRAAKTKPADYGQGITNLAQGLDEYIFDQIDPERVAARQREAAERAERLRLMAAQGALDKELTRLADLLEDSKDYPSVNVGNYKDTLDKGQAVRRDNNPEKMLAEADTMRPSVDVLDEAVSQARSAHRAAVAWDLFLMLMVIATLGIIVYALAHRRSRQHRLEVAFETPYRDWSSKVANAVQRWSSLYLDRTQIIGLEHVTGETATLWSKVTKDVDQILIRIEAMKAHLQTARAIADRGSYFRFEPYERALELLTKPFDFSTGQVNEADLFGGETVTIKVDPTNFAKETSALFEASMKGWKALKAAAETQEGDCLTDFPHSELDTLLEACKAVDVPDVWLASHPLYGDKASDDTFYAQMNELRSTDPIAYVARRKEVQALNKQLANDIEALTIIIKKVEAARIKAEAITVPETFLPTDPATFVAEGRELEEQMRTLCQNPGPRDKTLNDVLAVASDAIDAYTKAVQLAAKIRKAVEIAPAEQADTLKRQKAAEDAYHKMVPRVTKAATDFTVPRLDKAQKVLDMASRVLTVAEAVVTKGKTMLVNKSHQNAIASFDVARNHFADIETACRHVEAIVAELYDNKRMASERIASQKDTHEAYSRRMAAFGTHAVPLEAPVRFAVTPNTDHANVLSVMDLQEKVWRDQVRQAEVRQAQEQQRVREARAAEERRQREAQEAERRRRSHYTSVSVYAPSYSSSSSWGSSSSSSSSSDSSWGSSGGGFGGDSGSSGGGGFGGSSGDF